MSMQSLIKYVLLIIFFCGTAQATPLLLSCNKKSIQWQKNTVELNVNIASSRRQPIYLFKNISPSTITITHVVPHPSASAGWPTTLDSHHYTALALDRKNFAITCYISNSNQVIPCKKVLRICEATHPRFTKKQSGSYWIVENAKSYSELVILAKKRNIAW